MRMSIRTTTTYIGAMALLITASACGSSTNNAASSSPEASSSSQSAPTSEGASAPATAPAGSGIAGLADGAPIVLGAAIDESGIMKPFDKPALVAAQYQIDKINSQGGVLGHQLKIEVVDTKSDPSATKSAAQNLLSRGIQALVVSCDVDLATPAVQVGLEAKLLTLAPCTGTDQMGPKRFGDPGKLAFSFGNVAQDEGAAMAEYAISQGWKSAIVIPDNSIVYFKNVCEAFAQRFKAKGGTIAATESFTQGDGSVNSVVTAIGSDDKVDVITMCSQPPDSGTLVSQVRSAGIDTQMLGAWSSDGDFWAPKGLTNFTYTTFSSAFGDDPNPDVNKLAKALADEGEAPTTGGFVTGAAMVEAFAHVVEETKSVDGATLAAAMEKLNLFPTISGKVSFSSSQHTVFGREYRVMSYNDGHPKFKELFTASSPQEIG